MNEEDQNVEDPIQNEDAGAEAGAEEEFGGELNLDRLGELEKELEEVRQHVLYAQAETQNVRRRLEQEKVNAANYAATAFARDMLSVKDNLERALAAIPAELREDERLKGLVAGIELPAASSTTPSSATASARSRRWARSSIPTATRR